ncbi:MAG TPA: hypothetical protein VFM32_05460 [Spongiibacteraceae bacterium]|nr:hypothetical protein [Spongiibacteraceae bacterium]
MQLRTLKKGFLLIGLCAPLLAHAEFGVYVKGGTLGAGAGIGYGFNDNLTARIGYTAANISHDLHTTDVDYKGDVKIGGAEALLDWHPFAGAFRVTAGAILSRNEIKVDAKLNHTPIYINGTPYDVNDISSIDGKVEFKKTAPYLGIGWGNVADREQGFHFIADVGVEFMGTPKVKINASCAPIFETNMPADCAQLLSDVRAEEEELNSDASDYKWWPVLSVGFAYRF